LWGLVVFLQDVTTEFSFGAWFSDGVDNLIHAPQLSLNLLAMGHEGTSNAHADALKVCSHLICWLLFLSV
jgi:hypothetical protein